MAERAEEYAQEAAELESLEHPQALQLLGRFAVFPGFHWYLRHHDAAVTRESQLVCHSALQRWVGSLVVLSNVDYVVYRKTDENDNAN